MQDKGPDRFRAHGPETAKDDAQPQPVYELSVENTRELDRRAVEEYEIPSILLMENAAVGLREHALRMLGDGSTPAVLVCCGPGNNGGDGFALARHLHNAGLSVRVVHTRDFEQYIGDAGTNLRILEHMGIELIDARIQLETPPDASLRLIVDALFGTGLSRAVEGIEGELIEWINIMRQRTHAKILSVDIPSGLDADSGEPMGERVVRADRTVTFAGYKPGLSKVEAASYLGEVHSVPIGVPIELVKELGTAIEPKHRE